MWPMWAHEYRETTGARARHQSNDEISFSIRSGFAAGFRAVRAPGPYETFIAEDSFPGRFKNDRTLVNLFVFILSKLSNNVLWECIEYSI